MPLRAKQGGYRVSLSYVLPRVLLAGLIGYTLGIPLELSLFGPEITDQIKAEQRTESQAAAGEVAKARIDACKREFKISISEVQHSLADAEKNKTDTINGHGSGPGCGQICRGFNDSIGENQAKLLSLEQQEAQCIGGQLPADPVNGNESVKAAWSSRQEIEAEHASPPTFLRQLTALHALSQRNSVLKTQEERVYIAAATLFIPMLFIFVEIVPVLSKLLAGVGAYDMYAHEEKAEAQAAVLQRDIEFENSVRQKQSTAERETKKIEGESIAIEETHARVVHEFCQSVRDTMETAILSARQRLDLEPEVTRFSDGVRQSFKQYVEHVFERLPGIAPGRPALTGVALQPLSRRQPDTDDLSKAAPAGNGRDRVDNTPAVNETSEGVRSQFPDADAPRIAKKPDGRRWKINPLTGFFNREPVRRIFDESGRQLSDKVVKLIGTLFDSALGFVSTSFVAMLGVAKYTPDSMLTAAFIGLLVLFFVIRAVVRNNRGEGLAPQRS